MVQRYGTLEARHPQDPAAVYGIERVRELLEGGVRRELLPVDAVEFGGHRHQVIEVPVRGEHRTEPVLEVSLAPRLTLQVREHVVMQPDPAALPLCHREEDRGVRAVAAEVDDVV